MQTSEIANYIDLNINDVAAAGMSFGSLALPLTPIPSGLLVVTSDTVPNDTSSNVTLAIGATTSSTIDTIGDLDFYKINLVAGRAYEIGMFAKAGGASGLPLQDSYLELYNAQGQLIASADGGASTTINTANSGFDAILSFTPTASGTYYVNARAFDNVAQDGTNGDLVGDYDLSLTDVTDVPHYVPYYDASSPLYAIDWGTRVNKIDQTAANPDGNEGIRPTGNAQGTPVLAQSTIDAAAAQHINTTGKNVITVYFAKAGDVFVSNDLTEPGLPPATITATGVQDFERLAVTTALAEFAKVADVVYVEVQDRTKADFIYTSYQGTPGPGVSLLGSMSPPDESDEGLAQFNSGDYRWNARDLGQGGFSFVTLIHEFGHGHGLAHPHDNGGHSGIMNGVEPEGAGVADYTTGDYHLNQSVFTMMSYEDGWQDSPYGNAATDVGYGYLGGLMAFDIAAIQDKYGVNEDYATGNDTYVLKDVNAVGTYYTSIWDAGGTDQIVYNGARDTTIDLRPATLKYEEGGGGRVSFAYGIYGGYTIANAVTIENARSDAGNDTLIGNDVANVLSAGAGTDTLSGMAGDEQLDGGTGADVMNGGTGNDLYFVDNGGDRVNELVGQGNDRVLAAVSYTLAAGQEVETLSTQSTAGTGAIDLTGNAFANTLIGNAGVNILNGGDGADVLIGLGGNDVLIGGAGANALQGGTGNDTYYVSSRDDSLIEFAGEGNDTVRTALATYTIGSNVENLVYTGTAGIVGTGNAAANTIVGGAGDDILSGLDGADFLYGGTGADVLIGGTGAANTMQGGAGNDRYYVSVAGDSIIENAGEGYDTIATDLAQYTLATANVEALVYVGTGTFRGTGSGGNDVIAGGANADQLYGLAGSDTLIGGAGADSLFGGDGNDSLTGGAGNDRLTGGNGSDQFVFGSGGIDTVTDFAAGSDRIVLDHAMFAALGLGALAAGAFVRGTAALDADDRIIYNAATGALLYDPDGTGAQAAVQFASVTMQSGTLAASDFVIV